MNNLYFGYRLHPDTRSSFVVECAAMNRRKMRIQKMGSIQLRQTKRRMIWNFLLLLAFCCVFTDMALAQLDQGAINGIVKDSSGGAIPGALVTLTNTDTNFVLQGRTDAKGEYGFSPIKIGHYTVSATAPNFQTTTQQNITVNILDQLNIPLTLKPGSVMETVTV